MRDASTSTSISTSTSASTSTSTSMRTRPSCASSTKSLNTQGLSAPIKHDQRSLNDLQKTASRLPYARARVAAFSVPFPSVPRSRRDDDGRAVRFGQRHRIGGGGRGTSLQPPARWPLRTCMQYLTVVESEFARRSVCVSPHTSVTARGPTGRPRRVPRPARAGPARGAGPRGRATSCGAVASYRCAPAVRVSTPGTCPAAITFLV